jgi:2-amino-4-hydroxy-6-hydroxymethyldihydropteridine diphosphokinase
VKGKNNNADGDSQGAAPLGPPEAFQPQSPAIDPKTTAFIGLGANLGDLPANLAAARRAIGGLPGLAIIAASTVYRTEPQGVRGQPWFVNQVIAVSYDATWTASRLLAALLGIEAGLGRVRKREGGERFGPRPIDLDLLLFGGQVMDTPELVLPHPRLRERAFVLVPLAELAADLVFPDGERIGDALAKIAFQARGNVIGQH